MKKLLLLLCLPVAAVAGVWEDNSPTTQVFFANDSARAKVPAINVTPGDSVRVVGHTSTPASEEYNMALGLRRATWVGKSIPVSDKLIESRGESEATGNQKFDRRVDVFVECGQLNFPCVSPKPDSWGREIPDQCCTVITDGRW